MIAKLVVTFAGAGDFAHERLESPCPEQRIFIGFSKRGQAQRDQCERNHGNSVVHRTSSHESNNGPPMVSVSGVTFEQRATSTAAVERPLSAMRLYFRFWQISAM